MSLSLRESLIRLAREDEVLRPNILQILDGRSAKMAEGQAPIIIQQPPIIIQQPPIVIYPPGVPTPPPTPPPVSNLFATERAQSGFKLELQPELERMTQSGMTKIQAAGEILDLLNEAFSNKDALYNILIGYQSSFEGDAEFLDSLTRLVETWASPNPGV